MDRRPAGVRRRGADRQLPGHPLRADADGHAPPGVPLIRRRATSVAIIAALALPACGASIQALYEGDVRFERCMALDERADVKPTLRRACWDEWLEFYTFGQTRDRIDHAR